MSATKSPTLKHFIELEDGSHKCIECEKDGVEKVYMPKTSTGTLSVHLRNKHKIGINPVGVENNSLVPLTESESADITNAFTKWIVVGLKPFTTCEDEHFIDFVR